VRHVAAAHLGLKRTFRQRTLSSMGIGAATPQAEPADLGETNSVNAASKAVKDGRSRVLS